MIALWEFGAGCVAALSPHGEGIPDAAVRSESPGSKGRREDDELRVARQAPQKLSLRGDRNALPGAEQTQSGGAGYGLTILLVSSSLC